MPVVKRHRSGDQMPAVIHPGFDPAAINLCRELASEVAVQCAILFGSRAQGGWDEQSDLDVIIVHEAPGRQGWRRCGKRGQPGPGTAPGAPLPGVHGLGSPHTGVEQGQMVVSLEHYLAHRRTLNDVTARAAREGRIFTGKAGAEQRYRHDGDTSNEWDLVTLERLKDAAGENEALAIVRKVYTPRPASRVSVHTIPGRNAHGLLWPAGAALLSSMGVIYPRYSVAEVAQALRENDPGWSHQFASDLDCIDQYAGCGCEVVVTDPIPDVPALWRALETDRDALWERIRELSGYDLNQPPPPTHSSS